MERECSIIHMPCANTLRKVMMQHFHILLLILSTWGVCRESVNDQSHAFILLTSGVITSGVITSGVITSGVIKKSGMYIKFALGSVA